MRSHSTEKQTAFISKLESKLQRHPQDDSGATSSYTRNSQGTSTTASNKTQQQMVSSKKRHMVMLSLAKTGIEHPFLTEKFKFKDYTREFEPIAAFNVCLLPPLTRL